MRPEGNFHEEDTAVCQFTDRSSSSLLSFNDEFDSLFTTDVDVFSTAARCHCRRITSYGDCTSWSSVSNMDLEPEFGPWACHYGVSVPGLGAKQLPVPVTKATWSRTAKFGLLTTNESRSTQAFSENVTCTDGTPVTGRSTLDVRFNQPLAFRCFYKEDGSSTSVYAERYRRHCTAQNVGSAVVGERTLADLQPSEDPYLRQMRTAV